MRYIFIALLFCGCSSVSSYCPPFPEPSQKVLDMLNDLSSEEVDSWMEKLYKLNQKLKLYEE